jgi:hypothetical protein
MKESLLRLNETFLSFVIIYISDGIISMLSLFNTNTLSLILEHGDWFYSVYWIFKVLSTSGIGKSHDKMRIDINTLQEDLFIQEFIVVVQENWSIVDWRETKCRYSQSTNITNISCSRKYLRFNFYLSILKIWEKTILLSILCHRLIQWK